MAVTGVSGLASGIEWREIIDAMVTADRRSTVVLENRKTLLEGRLEAVRGLNTRMLSVDSEMFYLKRASTFNARTVSSNASEAVTATANSSTILGDYRVRIDQLAQAQQIASQQKAAGTTSTGTLTVAVGGAAAKSFDFSGKTMSEMATAINSEPGIGVTAQVLTDSGQERLVFTSKTSGATNTIALGGSLTAAGAVLETGTTTVLTAAQNAQATLKVGSGTPVYSTVTSTTNILTGLVGGMTITAKKAKTDDADFKTLTVSNDPAVAKQHISDFITALNDALTYYMANASYDTTTKEGGVLFAEGDLRSGMNGLRQAMTASADADAGDIRTMTALGISVDEKTGLYSIDEDVLDEVLARAPESVRDFFVAGGVADRLDEQVNQLTDAVDGLLAAKDDTLSDTLVDLTGRIEDMDARLEARRQRYEAQFTAMEKLISSLTSQQSVIQNQISGFENMASARANG